MMKIRKAVLIAPLLLATSLLPFSAGAQNRNHNRDNPNFYNGVRNGGRGGQYYNNNDRRYDNRQNQGGIGPGKGALIGAGGGAVLGALFGGGLKGTLIGGAAGAGIGAIVGEVHQNNQRNDRDRRYDRR
jgi:hypothetical protein